MSSTQRLSSDGRELCRNRTGLGLAWKFTATDGGRLATFPMNAGP